MARKIKFFRITWITGEFVVNIRSISGVCIFCDVSRNSFYRHKRIINGREIIQVRDYLITEEEV